MPPASATFSAPPRNTCAMIAFGSSRGNPATASAKRTSPPIAYTSDIALAAATAPHVYASSTTGGKKSTVSTIARSGVTRYTAASSAWPRPTSRSRSSPPSPGLIAPSTSWRSPGAILDAQPAQEAYAVRRMSLPVIPLRRRRGELRFEEREEREGQRRATALAIRHEVERTRHRHRGDLDARHEPGTAFVLDRALRDERDDDAGAHALLHRLRGAHLTHDPKRRQARVRGAERALERFARTRATLAHHHRFGLELGEGDGLPTRPRVLGRYHDDQLIARELARLEGALRRPCADDGELDTALVDPLAHLSTVADEQHDGDLRLLRLELSNQRRKDVLARNRATANDELTGEA